MKLYVVKVREQDPPAWGMLNEAVVRAESAEQAKRLLFASWGPGWDRVWLDRLRAAEILVDGSAGIVSGTALS